MTAPRGRIARFDLIDGQMILHSRAGGWVFYDDHTAAIAALEAELSSGSFYKESDIDALQDRIATLDAERLEALSRLASAVARESDLTREVARLTMERDAALENHRTLFLDFAAATTSNAAAEARGLRMAAERVYTKLQDRARKNATYTNDAQAARDIILALIPAPPAPKETPDE